VDEGIEGADEFRSERRRATAAAATGAVLGAHQSASAVPPSSSAVPSAIGAAARRELQLADVAAHAHQHRAGFAVEGDDFGDATFGSVAIDSPLPTPWRRFSSRARSAAAVISSGRRSGLQCLHKWYDQKAPSMVDSGACCRCWFPTPGSRLLCICGLRKVEAQKVLTENWL
jgi:hypothetical protein